MSVELKMTKKIPASLRNPFWVAFMDTVEEEILNMRTEIEKKKTVLSYREADIETLMDLASDFIILPRETFEGIRTLLSQAYGMSDEQIEYYLRQELYKLPFNNKEKGTLSFYRSLFSTFGFTFPHQISIYRVTLGIDHPLDKYTYTLVRDLEPFLDNIDSNLSYLFVDELGVSLGDDYAVLGFDGVRPALHVQQSTNNFAGYVSSARLLDAGKFVEDEEGEYIYDENLHIYLHRADAEGVTKYRWDGLTFDENPPIQFNTISENTLVSTKHIAFELQPNKVIIKSFEPYAVPYEALQFIFSSLYYYKRQTEVPHVGVQMSFVFDKSGYWDIHSDEVITDNVVPLPTFAIDYIWSREEGWRIENNVATLSVSTTPPTVPPILATPLILPRKTLQDVMDLNLGNFEDNTQVRFTIEINSMSPIGSLPFGLQVFTMTESRTFVRSVLTANEAGRYTVDIKWNDSSLGITGEYPIVGIMSYVPVELGLFEVYPFDKFSIPELRVKGAMQQNIGLSGIDSINYIEFGSGTQVLPSSNDIVYDFPTGLSEPLARVVPRVPLSVNSAEFVEDDTFIGAIGTYYGQMRNNIYLNTFPVGGSNTLAMNLPSELLPYKKGTLVLGIRDTTDLFGNPVVIFDDGMGRLVNSGVGLAGTINYVTGEINLDTGENTYFDNNTVYVEKIYIENTTTVREAGVWGIPTGESTLKLLAYMTFAPVDLYSNVFHLNLGVVLEK